MIGFRRYTGEHLEVSPETSLSLELLNPCTQFGELQGSFSFPFDLPATPVNRALMAELQRPDAASGFHREEAYTLEFRGAPLFYGKLSLLEVTDGAFSLSFTTDLGSLASDIAGKKLTSLSLGGVMYFGPGTIFKTFAESTLTQPLSDLRFCFPMLINREAFKADAMPQYTGYLNYYDNEGILGPGYHLYVLSGPYTGKKKSAFLPCLFLSKVLGYCFTENGWKLEGEILEDPLFQRTIMVSDYVEESDYYYGTNNQGNDVRNSTSLNPQNHVPDWTVGEFITAVCRIFGQAPSFNTQTKTCRLISMSRLLGRARKDWTGKLHPSAEGIKQQIGGYLLRHDSDSLLKPGEGRTGEVPILGDNDFSVTSNPPGAVDSIRYDTHRNVLRKKDDGTFWYRISENGLPEKTGDGGTDISVKWLPVTQWASVVEAGDAGDALDLGGWNGEVFSPARTPNAEHSIDTLKLAQWWGLQPGADEYDIPTAYTFNLSRAGSRLGGGSLHWHGPEGLYARYWEVWARQTTGAKLVTYTGTLGFEDLAGLDFTRPVQVQNQLYLIHRISVTLNSGGIQPATIELFKI